MDNHQRRKRHSHFWIKFIFSLGCFCLFYFFLIRPIQTIIVAEVVVPALQSIPSNNSDFLIQSKQDDYLIESHSNKFIDLKYLEQLRNRFAPLFKGEFETGIEPDEWDNWYPDQTL